jgi:hypothetical protein
MKKQDRQKKALEQLKKQLLVGTKPGKDSVGKTTEELVPLTEGDKDRIKKEIAILEKA